MLLAGFGLTVFCARADILGTNLLVNPNAEAGAYSPDGFAVVFVPGWETNGDFNVVSYFTGGGFPLTTDPGPPNRGTNFFAGGPDNASSSAEQHIDISSAASDVDSAALTCTLSGYLGGYSSQGDNAVLTALFQNAESNLLGSVTIGPVTAVERAGLTGLLYREAKTPVPVGTRQIQVTLQMSRLEGSYDDGYADNLSLVLSDRPQLNITPTGNRVALTWLTNATGFQLETTTNLTGIIQWTNTSIIPVIVGNSFVVTNSTTNAQQFFRLKK